MYIYLSEKLHISNNYPLDVIADKEVPLGKHRSKKRGKRAKLDKDPVTAIAQLRSWLRGEEAKEVVTKPVKETLSAGKSMLSMGQKFSSWVASIVKS